MLTCPSCGQQNPDGARFCNACASPLQTDEGAIGEERKNVTVVFVDLVGFTAQAEQLDPEDVRGMLMPYHAQVRTELERYGGTVEKFIGDAVMAVFGAPVAHEDDPERAVRAALAIRDWAAEQPDLQVRTAASTGEALVSIGARPAEGEAMVAGDVVNTAARLQAAAPVNGVLVGETTYRATRDAIRYREAAPVQAKGKAELVRVWEAVEATARFGVDVAERVKTPLVGRERELELLASILARVREERAAQLVTLVGVPGIGKSRLVLELFRAVERDPELITWRQGRCLPYGESVTFWALGEIVKADAGILESDDAEEAARKLHRTVTALVPEASEARWVQEQLRALVGLTTERARDAGAEAATGAWRRFFEAIAERGPTVLVIEDLHWADEGLLDFLDDLVDWLRNVPLLVVATARPELLERRQTWGGGKANATTITLQPLADDDAARLIAMLLDRPLQPADEQRTLLERTGGNPLFAEQYVRMLTERGSPGELPVSVQGVIAARLDALPRPEKELLQEAAVLGKVFWVGGVRAVGDVSAADSERLLRTLERKDFVRRERRSAVAGDTQYSFQHVLLLDVAYGQIPRRARAEKHRRAAEWIEALGRPQDHAELLAYHYKQALDLARAVGAEESDLVQRARRALCDAGARAVGLGAYSAATRFYTQAFELTSSDDADRPQLLLEQGHALFAADGSGREQLLEALEELREIGDAEGAAEAAIYLSNYFWYRGEQDESWTHLETALDLVDDRPASRARANALVTRASRRNLAGERDEAIRLAREALPVVEQFGIPALRARVLNVLGTARAYSGDPRGVDDVEMSITVAREANAFVELHACLENLRCVHWLFGRVPDASEILLELAESVERTGRAVDRLWVDAGVAEEHFDHGRWDEASRISDQFLGDVEAGTPHYLEPQQRSLRAAIALARDDVAGAARETARAVEVARRARDPQVVVPALGARAIVMLARGSRGEAAALAQEALALREVVPVLCWGGFPDLVTFAWLMRDVGLEAQLLALLPEGTAIPWAQAARAVFSDDFGRAADILAEIDFPPGEAYSRLRAAESLVDAGRRTDAEEHLERALAFYRKVGATRYIAAGTRLYAASA